MDSPNGILNLAELLKHMEPTLNKGDYVFCTVEDIEAIPRSVPICEMKESEGVTVVLLKSEAEILGLSYDFIASWITLNIHSSLSAVGLTAAFSAALTKHNISCNVIAGYYHDHIFVEVKDKENALKVLKEMSEGQ